MLYLLPLAGLLALAGCDFLFGGADAEPARFFGLEVERGGTPAGTFEPDTFGATVTGVGLADGRTRIGLSTNDPSGFLLDPVQVPPEQVPLSISAPVTVAAYADGFPGFDLGLAIYSQSGLLLFGASGSVERVAAAMPAGWRFVLEEAGYEAVEDACGVTAEPRRLVLTTPDGREVRIDQGESRTVATYTVEVLAARVLTGSGEACQDYAPHAVSLIIRR